MSHGGVGRNIAESLARLGTGVSLATAIAEDVNGLGICETSQDKGIDISLVKVVDVDENQLQQSATGTSKTIPAHRTAVYNAIHDHYGDLSIGVADMEILSEVDPVYIQSISDGIRGSRIVVSDGNLSPDAFRELASICSQSGASLFFEPTSDHKCLLPFITGTASKVRFQQSADNILMILCFI